jgi:predicted ferric reductase
MNNEIWWYVARSGGIVAWAMLTFSTLWGLALTTRVFGAKPKPAWMLDLHRFAGGLAVVFTGVHVVGLVFDSFVYFGLTEILVPFTSDYRPEAVAWGVLGFYLLIAVEITSLLRRHLPKRAWRLTHYLSFPLFVVATAHGLTAGSDNQTVLLRFSFLLAAVAVGALTALRLFPEQEPSVRSELGAR